MAQEKISFKKSQLFFFVVFACSFFGLLYWNTRGPAAQEIVLKDEVLSVYVAKTIKDTYVGLGGRNDLGGKDGMLFLFDYPGRHGIVMRNMRFPIDIVWLDNGEVVDIAPAVPLEPGVPEQALTVYRPRADATMVIELAAGWAAAHGLSIGDTVRLP